MKLAIIVLLVLPLAYSASVDEKRFLEGLTGGVDILALAQQAVAQFSTDETEQQCEQTICPNLLNKIPLPFHIDLVHDLLCGSICKEAEILAQHLTAAGK